MDPILVVSLDTKASRTTNIPQIQTASKKQYRYNFIARPTIIHMVVGIHVVVIYITGRKLPPPSS